MTEGKLLELVNEIRERAGMPNLVKIDRSMELRKDLGLDSLGLATLTVRVEDITGVDVFEDGLVLTVGEVLSKLK